MGPRASCAQGRSSPILSTVWVQACTYSALFSHRPWNNRAFPKLASTFETKTSSTGISSFAIGSSSISFSHSRNCCRLAFFLPRQASAVR